MIVKIDYDSICTVNYVLSSKNYLEMRKTHFLNIKPYKLIFREVGSGQIMVPNSFENYLMTLINFFDKNNIGYIIILNISIIFFFTSIYIFNFYCNYKTNIFNN